MSVEVDLGEYMFIPDQRTKTYSRPGHAPQTSAAPRPAPQPLPTWNYNPLHDVESVFWLTKFFTVNHDVVFTLENDSELNAKSLALLGIALDKDPPTRGTRLDAQYKQVDRLFRRTDGRYHELTTPRVTPDRWYIHPELIRRNLYDDIEAIRVKLVSTYRKVEGGFADCPPKPLELDPELYWTFFGALQALGEAVRAVPACVRIVQLALAVQAYDVEKATPVQSAPAIPTIRCDNVDNPSDAAETRAVTAKLQSFTLDPFTAGQLHPTLRNEPRPQSRASRPPSRAPSRTAPRPPSRTAPRPTSRTGLRSQSRTGLNRSREPLLNPAPDAHSSLYTESRPASRTAPRSTSRAQNRSSEAGVSCANASAGATAKEGAFLQTRPSSANAGKGKGRVTTPLPPVPPANPRPARAQATQGAYGTKNKPGKLDWR